MIKFLKYKKVYYTIALILIIGSLFSLAFFGLNLGIEFTGGSIIEIQYDEARPTIETIKNQLANLDLGEITIQPVGEQGFVIRMRDIPEETYEKLLLQLEGATVNYSESIDPTIGDELMDKAVISTILSSLAIIIYIAITFSGAGGTKIKSWQYGVIAAGIGFFHDILIVLGFFAVVGYFYGIQVTIPIIVAILTVLGYSVNDTVVIFDRVRENLFKNPKLDFPNIVEKSLNETLGRSINTSFTTLLVLFAVFFFGGETIRWFSLAMIIGISLGVYSSIFLAGPLLVFCYDLNKKIIK